MQGELDKRLEIFSQILERSIRQRQLLSEENLVEVIILQKEREDLLGSLGPLEAARYRQEPLRSAIASIIESDRALYTELETAKGGLSARLNQIRSGFKAIRAYGDTY